MKTPTFVRLIGMLDAGRNILKHLRVLHLLLNHSFLESDAFLGILCQHYVSLYDG